MSAQKQSGGSIEDGQAGLLPYVSLATRAMVGLAESQDLFDAATTCLQGSEDIVLIIELCDEKLRLRLASSSIDPKMARALETFIGEPLTRRRLVASKVPLFVDVLTHQQTRSATVAEFCRQIFSPSVAGKVAGLLGGGDAWAIITPLNHRSDPVGLLCAITADANQLALAALIQLSESLNAALCAAEILRHVRQARSTLSADHPAQHYLGAAVQVAGHGSPGALRSLVPTQAVLSLRPPHARLGNWPSESADTCIEDTPKARILLVEDEERIRKSTVTLLSSLGYSAQGVATGEQAIATYTRAHDSEYPIDLLLLDQHLSGRIGGVETMRIVQSVNPQAKAILISGQDPGNDELSLQRFGFVDVLSKPVPLEQLSASIERALQAQSRRLA